MASSTADPSRIRGSDMQLASRFRAPALRGAFESPDAMVLRVVRSHMCLIAFLLIDVCCYVVAGSNTNDNVYVSEYMV